MRKLTRKPSLKSTLAENRKAMNWMALMSGKEPMPAEPVKKPRKAPEPTGLPLESDVQRAIIAYLSVHPNVLMAWRVNSGAAHTDTGSPIWFYRVFKTPNKTPIRLPDIMGVMRDGRQFAIEVKRPGWKKPSVTREEEQQNYLLAVAEHGLAGFATSLNEAAAILGGDKRRLLIQEV